MERDLGGTEAKHEHAPLLARRKKNRREKEISSHFGYLASKTLLWVYMWCYIGREVFYSGGSFLDN